MGREATARITFGGQSAPGKILLESQELILRGTLRARIPRQDITGFAVEGDDLVLQTRQGPIRAGLGNRQAALWLKALAKPPPSLAAKLGISPETPARLLDGVTDPALRAALTGCTAPDGRLLIAEIADSATLDRALAALADPGLAAFWAVTVKGRTAPLPEATLRSRLRAAGFIDTKTCAVSETRTATRFQRR